MHLLVLSAFRPSSIGSAMIALYVPVSMHLLVLSAFRPKTAASIKGAINRSQCTFWCSVLSDGR